MDSPLARKATDVFVAHPECYDAETKAFIGEGGEPFHPAGVHYVESRQESKALNQAKLPFVVIAGSGILLFIAPYLFYERISSRTLSVDAISHGIVFVVILMGCFGPIKR